MRYIDIANGYLVCSLKVSKKRSAGKLNILSISQIIFHKVHAPVTCWEVVVHHLRPAYSMMDGMRLQTLWGT